LRRSTSTSLPVRTKKPGAAIASVGLELLLLAGAALIFALSFPSFLSQWGWFPLAFVALTPVFIVVHRAGWVRTVLYGAFFGFASYALYNYWLGSFHPLTLLIVPPIYSVYFLAVFPLLKAADSLFPRYGFILQALIWVAYEFAKIQGFLGYAYGVIGFSQYLFLPLARLSSVTGVWGVSLIVVFPSALLGNALKNGFGEFVSFLRRMRVPVLLYAAVFAAVAVFGLLNKTDLDSVPRRKIVLVQQNVDPWKGGNKTYAKTLEILTRLSRKALAEDPSIDIVIWSETSFVPAIDWHTRYRTDRVAFGLVKELREFLAQQTVPFVVGNDDGQLAKDERGRDIRVDYNAAILFDKGEIVDIYRKLHLVPFTEDFPYKETLPRIYQWLKDADTHFWEKGDEYTVFEAGNVRFSTPICFEDTFPNLNRQFIRRGAEMLVNLTNDAWSKAVACEMQHMSIAAFRTLENKRTLVRSTNGGITCVIDPNGQITAMLPPFTEGYLIAEAPVYTASQTLYTRWGDWFAILVSILALLGLVGGLLYRLIGRGR
jgi:apolipoprotein N-acyltransferase